MSQLSVSSWVAMIITIVADSFGLAVIVRCRPPLVAAAAAA